MALTWGQLKAIAVAAALPDTAAVVLEIDLAGGTASVAVPGYTVTHTSLQKTLDSAVVTSGKLVGS